MISYSTWKNYRLRERLLEQTPVPNPPVTMNGVQGYHPAQGTYNTQPQSQNPAQAQLIQTRSDGKQVILPPLPQNIKNGATARQAPQTIRADRNQSFQPQAAQGNSASVVPAPGSGAYFGYAPDGSNVHRFPPNTRLMHATNDAS